MNANKRIFNHWPETVLLIVVLLAFLPVFWGKIPLNARNLVAFFSPWYYQKFEGFPSGVQSKPGMLDQIRLYYPYMRLTQDSYRRRGELPLWNPYNFAGNPHMAEWQSGAFYPLHVLLIILPLPVYWTLYQMLGFFLAGWFTFLFLRNLKLGKTAAILAAASFMLSGFMTTWNMEVVTATHSILWLPLILLAIDKLMSNEQRAENNEVKIRITRQWWLTGLAGLVMSILSGYWQTTFYVMVVSAIYILYRWFFGRTQIFAKQKSAGTPEPSTRALATRPDVTSGREQVSVVLGLFLWFPFALALTAFQLLPTWELYQRSSRPLVNSSPRLQEILTGYLLPMRHLVTLAVPDYFGHPTTRNYFAGIGGTYYEHALFFGTLPLFLAILAVVNGVRVSHRLSRWRKFARSPSPARPPSGNSGQALPRRDVGVGWPQTATVSLANLPTSIAILARNSYREKLSGDIWFWVILGLGLGSLSFDLPWSRWIYEIKFPVLSTGIANRVLFVPAFAGVVLAAFGLESIKATSNPPKAGAFRRAGRRQTMTMFVFLTGLTGLAAVTWVFKNGLGAINPVWHPDLYLTSLRNMVIPATVLILAAVAILTRSPRMTVTILILAIFQNLYQHHKFTAFSETEFIYPETKALSWLKNNAGLNRFLGYNGQFLGNDFATFFGIYTVEGYDSLNDSRRAALVQSAVDGKLNPDLPTSADVELDRNLKNERVTKLMRLFGIRYLVDYPEWLDVGPTAGLPRLPAESEKLVFHDGDWKIWEYSDAFPRAFLVGKYEVVEDGQKMIDRLYDKSFNPRGTLLLSNPLANDFNIDEDFTSSVEVEKYSPTKIIFRTKSKTNQLLFISDTYYPGWWAKIDGGEKQPVVAADYTLRAVPVAAGEHTITMWYFPDSFRKGLIVAGAAALAVIVITSRRFWTTRGR